MKTKTKAPLTTKTTAAVGIEILRRKYALLLIPLLACAFIGTPVKTAAQEFASYPAGDDNTFSLGQFQIVLEPAWAKVYDVLIPNSPLGTVSSTRHIKLYHKGVFTSPTLYDQSTMIGRSDPFAIGSPLEFAGTLPGRAPGRTYVTASQFVVHPSWPEPAAGGHVIHTFLKSMHLTDSFTGQFGFSVRAGMLAPTRPVSAGQVEAGTAQMIFPPTVSSTSMGWWIFRAAVRCRPFNWSTWTRFWFNRQTFYIFRRIWCINMKTPRPCRCISTPTLTFLIPSRAGSFTSRAERSLAS